MLTRSFSFFPVSLAIFILVSPVTAGSILSGVSFLPDTPLVPGGEQHLAATYVIIPSGSTTFARGHSLQMQTDLTGAQWTIQVTVNGGDAARQTASGSAAFVNGELLSYSTDNDVGMVVTLDGTVPPDASGSVMVLQIEELDNSGTVVPGSVLAINQPVSGATTPAVPPAVPTLTSPRGTSPLPKGTPGFALPAVVLALVAGVLFLRATFRVR
jgi:hypothetical protein